MSIPMRMSTAPSEPDPRTSGTQLPDPRRSSRDRSVVVDEQPKPSRLMMSINGGGDRNTLRVPVMSDGLRPWSFGLLDCFADLPTCVLATCCCCYVYSRNKQRYTHLDTQGVPLRAPVPVYNHDCIAWCFLQIGLVGAGWGLQAMSRSDTRRRYGIRGDACNDILVSGFCGPCQLVQEHREIQLEESGFSEV